MISVPRPEIGVHPIVEDRVCGRFRLDNNTRFFLLNALILYLSSLDFPSIVNTQEEQDLL